MFNDLPELLLQGEDVCDLHAHRLLHCLERYMVAVSPHCARASAGLSGLSFCMWISSKAELHGAQVLVLGQLGVEGDDQLLSILATSTVLKSLCLASSVGRKTENQIHSYGLE